MEFSRPLEPTNWLKWFAVEYSENSRRPDVFYISHHCRPTGSRGTALYLYYPEAVEGEGE